MNQTLVEIDYPNSCGTLCMTRVGLEDAMKMFPFLKELETNRWYKVNVRP